MGSPGAEKAKGVPGLQGAPMVEKVCSICGQRCIAKCPYCPAYVCPAYGRYGTQDCGTRHESKCPRAREARLGDKPPPLPVIGPVRRPVYDTVVVKKRKRKGKRVHRR